MQLRVLTKTVCEIIFNEIKYQGLRLSFIHKVEIWGETARKRHTRRMETENQETERRKAKDGTSTGMMMTEILEYDMTEMLTDERRYKNSETNGTEFKKQKQRNRYDKNWEFDSWCT